MPNIEIRSSSYLQYGDIPAMDDALDFHDSRIRESLGGVYLLIGRLSDRRCFSVVTTRDALMEAVASDVRPALVRLLSRRRWLLRFRKIKERASVTVVYAEDTRFGMTVVRKPHLALSKRGHA